LDHVKFHETKLNSGFIKTREPYAFKLLRGNLM